MNANGLARFSLTTSVIFVQAYLFGGCGESDVEGTYGKPFDDMYVLKCAEGMAWGMRSLSCVTYPLDTHPLSAEKVETSGEAPSARWGHTCIAVDDIHLWLFGGVSGGIR